MCNQVFQAYSFEIVRFYGYVNFLVSIGEIERVRTLHEEQNILVGFWRGRGPLRIPMIRFLEVLWTVW